MRFDKFDANLLAALEVLLETRSVTVASQRLHLSVSATSSALARIREYFGDPILLQVGREMVPTSFGQALLTPTKEALRSIRQVISRPSGFDPARSERVFSIACADYLSAFVLAPMARTWAATSPGLRLRHITTRRDEWPALLRSGEVDLVIWPQAQTLVEHMARELAPEMSVCVAWSENETVGTSLTREAFMNMGHVVVQLGTRAASHWESWLLSTYGSQRRIEVIVDTFDLVPRYVVGTNRIALMHMSHAEKMAEYFPLRLVANPLNIPPLQLVMQWHQSKEWDEAHRWLRQQTEGMSVPYLDQAVQAE